MASELVQAELDQVKQMRDVVGAQTRIIGNLTSTVGTLCHKLWQVDTLISQGPTQTLGAEMLSKLKTLGFEPSVTFAAGRHPFLLVLALWGGGGGKNFLYFDSSAAALNDLAKMLKTPQGSSLAPELPDGYSGGTLDAKVVSPNQKSAENEPASERSSSSQNLVTLHEDYDAMQIDRAVQDGLPVPDLVALQIEEDGWGFVFGMQRLLASTSSGPELIYLEISSATALERTPSPNQMREAVVLLERFGFDTYILSDGVRVQVNGGLWCPLFENLSRGRQVMAVRRKSLLKEAIGCFDGSASRTLPPYSCALLAGASPHQFRRKCSAVEV